MKKASFVVELMSIIFGIMVLADCTSAPNTITPFEQYRSTFSRETKKTENMINETENLIKDASSYETRVGDIPTAEYDTVEKLIAEMKEAKQNTHVQLQSVNELGHSVTADGYYTNTGKKIKGFDAVVYGDMHIPATLSVLDQRYTNILAKYNNVDFNVLKRPNKPFNASAMKIIRSAKIEILAAQSDVAAKDWAAGKKAVERANGYLKNAINLDLNDIEQYQIVQVQTELKKVSNDISIGSGIDTAGSVLEEAAKGAAGILGGFSNILKGIGDNVKKD